MMGDASINTSLSSLALLSLQQKEGNDYLDYLRGFVLSALRLLDGRSIDAESIRKVVAEEFGLRIPAATFSVYLKRLQKQKVLGKTRSGQHYTVINLPDDRIEQQRSNAKKQINAVIESLASFAYEIFELPWDEIESANHIAGFVNKYSIDFLRYYDNNSPLPNIDRQGHATAYVVARFITQMSEENKAVFDSIRVLVQSHILSNALLCPDLAKNPHGFKGITFLLDTRFVIKLLDLESALDAKSSRELVQSIKELKGSVAIFEETKEELRTVLHAIIRGIETGQGRGPVFRELLSRGRHVSDVKLVMGNLDLKLEQLNISTMPSPSYTEDLYQFQIDEAEFGEDIENEVSFISSKALEHDTRVVRHIFALRRGYSVSSIEEAKFVFLTTNTGLSRAAFNYERRNAKGWIFSAVVTDYHLSHLAWLKLPIQSDDLSQLEILANCYGTMKLNEKVWEQYLTEIDRLKENNEVTNRDHEVLRFAVNAPEELMDVTRGEVEGVTPENIHIVLDRLEQSFAKEKEEKIGEKNREIEHYKELLDNEENTMLSTREKHSLKLDLISEKISRICFYVAAIVLIAMAAIASYSNASYFIVLVFTLLGLTNLILGYTAKTLKVWIKRKVRSALESSFGISDT